MKTCTEVMKERYAYVTGRITDLEKQFDIRDAQGMCCSIITARLEELQAEKEFLSEHLTLNLTMKR